MPFGLFNAPSTFQRLVNDIFRPYLYQFVLVYLDDILVFSPSAEEHCKHLDLVADILTKHKLVVKPSKTQLFRRRITYLGMEIDGSGTYTTILPTPKVSEALEGWPVPINVKELQRFLGFINYYRQFILDYANIRKPLTQLLQKNVPFTWGQSHSKAFNVLRDTISSLPKLFTANPEKPFEIYADASNQAVSAVLERKGLPILYASRVLNEAEQRYSTYDKELLAIYFALKQLKSYIWGGSAGGALLRSP